MRDKVQRALNNPAELSNLLCKDFNIRMVENTRWLTYETANNDATFDMEQVYDSYAIGRSRPQLHYGPHLCQLLNIQKWH